MAVMVEAEPEAAVKVVVVPVVATAVAVTAVAVSAVVMATPLALVLATRNATSHPPARAPQPP